MTITDMRAVGADELMLTWDDGHRSLYTVADLRYLCPCASCVDEHTGIRTIKKENIPSNINVSEFAPVGRYAVRFRWSDGHQTGIYSFDYLRKICPCGGCAAREKS